MFGAFYFGQAAFGYAPILSYPVGAMGFAQIWWGYSPINTTAVIPVTPVIPATVSYTIRPIQELKRKSILENRKYMRQMRLQNL